MTAVDPTLEMLELNDAALASRAAGASNVTLSSSTEDRPPQYRHVINSREKSDVGGSRSATNVKEEEPTWLNEAGVTVSAASSSNVYV
jgi:hypothetical protein